MKKYQALHDVYRDATTAGKPEYLKAEHGKTNTTIITPGALKDQELEDKIREFWKVIQVNPQLVREEIISEMDEGENHNLMQSIMSNENMIKDNQVQLANYNELNDE